MKIKFWFFLCFFAFIPYSSYAGISLPWSTSFDYGPCSQRGVEGEISCAHVENDGIAWNWGAGVGPGDTYTQVTPDAKRPGSEGMGGARFWKYDGHNHDSGVVRVEFDDGPHEKLWIRWYLRYEKGFKWSTSFGSKLIRFSPGTTVAPLMHWYYSLVYSSHTAATVTNSQLDRFDTGGWIDNFADANGYSHGEFVCVELYLKMDTEGDGPFSDPIIPYNGIAKIWINGEFIGEKTNLSFSGGDPEIREGWTHFQFSDNQSGVDNENGPIGVNYAYEDWDDMVIYNKTPSNIDNHGNPFIGPSDWGSDTADLMPPQNVHFKSQ